MCVNVFGAAPKNGTRLKVNSEYKPGSVEYVKYSLNGLAIIYIGNAFQKYRGRIKVLQILIPTSLVVAICENTLKTRLN